MNLPDLPRRTEAELQRRQVEGLLRVCQAAEFRRLVQTVGLAEAYAQKIGRAHV